MKCPYCASDIAREALVCPVCRRDLYLFKPLLARIAELEARLADLPAIEALQARIQALEGQAGGAAGEVAAADQAPAPFGPGGWLMAWGVPLLLLLAAHGLVVIALDLNTLYLRILSLFIPLPFGYLLLRRAPGHFLLGTVAAFAMAALAVFGMSGVVAWTDGVPWLPQGRVEWREFVEYALSIGFSYLTGMLLARLHAQDSAGPQAVVEGNSLAVALARHLVSGPPSIAKIQEAVRRVNEIGSSLVALGTTALSIYTGLKGLVG